MGGDFMNLTLSEHVTLLEKLSASDQDIIDAVDKLLNMPSDIQKHTIETINLLFDSAK